MENRCCIDRLNPQGKPDRVLISSNHENILEPILYELDINTGYVVAIKTGGDNPEIYRWPVDGEGRILQSGITADEAASILQFNTATGEWSEIPAGNDTYQPMASIGISSYLAKLQRELDVEDIRVSSVDDKRSKAVLMVSSGQSTIPALNPRRILLPEDTGNNPRIICCQLSAKPSLTKASCLALY